MMEERPVSNDAVLWVGEEFPERLLLGDTWNGLTFPTKYAVIKVRDVQRCGYCGRKVERVDASVGEADHRPEGEVILSHRVLLSPCGHSKLVPVGESVAVEI